MSALLGLPIVGFGRGDATANPFQAHDPSTQGPLAPAFHAASAAEVARSCELADQAFDGYGSLPPRERAAFLRSIAQELEADGAALVARALAETGLPPARLRSELA